MMAAPAVSAAPKNGPLGCGKKTRYETVEHAVAVMKLRRHPRAVDRCKDPLYAYQCPVCSGFHITKLRPPGAEVIKC